LFQAPCIQLSIDGATHIGAGTVQDSPSNRDQDGIRRLRLTIGGIHWVLQRLQHLRALPLYWLAMPPHIIPPWTCTACRESRQIQRRAV